MTRQHRGHVGAHVPNAQAKEDARKSATAGLIHLRHDLLGNGSANENVLALGVVLGACLISAARGCGGKCVNGKLVVVVRDVGQGAILNQAAHQLVAQAVNVHGIAASPVDETLDGLRRAVDGDAAVCDLALLAHHGAPAAGTVHGHLEFLGVRGAQLEHGAHDLGNHVARLVHNDGVAHAHVLAAYLVDVVERGARDGRARNAHGVELGNGSEHAGAAHLDADVAQDRTLLLGRELERDGPAWRAGGEAKHRLAGKGVDLHHHAVDVVVEVLSVRERGSAEVVHLSRTGAAAGVGIYVEAAAGEPVQELPLAGYRERRLVRHGVDEGLEVAVGRDLGILLAQAAGGGVSRVGKGLATCGVRRLVQADERVLGHVDLAAHLDGAAKAGVGHELEALGRKRAGHVMDREHVGRDVLARRAVAAGGSTHELGVRVCEGHAQAIDLELAGVGHGILWRRTQGLVGAGEPLVKLVQVHGVVDGVHAASVTDGLELLGNIAAHALGVGVRRDQLRVGLLKGEKLLEVAVELGIRHLGRVKRVVGVGRVVEDAVELGGTGARRACGAGGLLRRFLGREGRRVDIAKERALHSGRVCVVPVGLLSHAVPSRARQSPSKGSANSQRN